MTLVGTYIVCVPTCRVARVHNVLLIAVIGRTALGFPRSIIYYVSELIKYAS